MNKLLLGDSLDVLKEIESESVDLLCTDPPYGYSFMGKSWDKTLPDIGIFKECLRVLKPGAFAFVMSAPRSDVQYRMIELIEKAGFDVGFTPLYHTYASGFPKAQNVHKKLTKNEEAREHELQELWRAVIHSSSPTEQSEHRSYLSSLLADLEQGEQREISFEDLTREEIQVSERQRKSCVERWSNLSEEERKLWGCEVCTMPRGLYVNGAKRWICYGTPNHSGDFTWEVADENGSRTSYKSRLHGQSFGKLDALCKQCRAQKIRTLNGAFSGWQPKPAVEVVIVAMKPLSEKTYVDQALKNQKGITWLDDCRVPTAVGDYASGGENNTVAFHTSTATKTERTQQHEGGRFPANLLVSDDVLNDGQTRKAGKNKEQKGTGGIWRKGSNLPIGPEYGDSGSYSRYFDLDAWAKTLPFLIVPKAAKSEKNAGLDELPKKQKVFNGQSGKPSKDVKDVEARMMTKPSANFHPTVKPLKLMSYLITLGSRPGDVVLDPFLGSGTTAVATKQLGRKYIGIEREAEYVEIARARVDATSEQTPNLFSI